MLAALTIGLANFLMVLEGLWLWQGRKIYLDVYLYWLKVFALLRQPQNPRARLQFSMALWMIVVLSPLQILVGDLQGQHSLKFQPQKVAAIEGSWTRPADGEGEPLRLFAIPDMAERRNHREVAIPRIGSLYLRHDMSGTIAALDEFPAEDIPPVPAVFFAFRFMVGLGLLMLGQGLTSLVLRWRQRLHSTRWMLRSCVLMARLDCSRCSPLHVGIVGRVQAADAPGCLSIGRVNRAIGVTASYPAEVQSPG